MRKQKIFFHASHGSVLAMAILVIGIGSAIVGSLMNFVGQDTMAVEKEIGHIKSKQVLTLAANLYNETIGNETGTVTSAQITTLTQLIGGGGALRPLFGQSTSNEISTIPGFDEYSVLWDQTSNVNSTTMVPPSGPNGFWYFPGTMSANITAIHTGTNVPATRNGSRAMLSSNNETQTVPVFSMLSFYDKDWEISAHWESAQCVGHIHANGSIYLDCRDSGPDRISFHGLQNYPILSANKAVYRRGRNGATSWYKHGNQANAGLDFYVYSESNFNNLVSSTDHNYSNNNSRLFTRDLTPDFTSYEVGNISDDSGQEPQRRRFAGGNVGDDYGYVFTGVSSVTSQNFISTDTNGDDVPVIQYDDQVDKLTPPVAINPYQYIEDIQYFDTPDTINLQPPLSSNYQEDTTAGGDLADLAFNAIAPLVIRDGVAYYRTTPGGSLTPVLNNLLSDNDCAYPDSSHANARFYGDLRWYGWFGMYDGVSPSETNPARWHFPIRSVTFNSTEDAANAGSAATSAEGTAVAFTYDSATVHDPVLQGMATLGGTAVNATWIRTDVDMSDLPGYPPSSASAPSDLTNGDGVGMYYSSYPTIEGNSYERYDPVRVAYNVVKSNVRTLHNVGHLYTSRHNGLVMLNENGSVPSAGSAPDIWGSSISSSNFGGGIDFDNADGDINDNTGVNFSAFWNDDGVLVNPSHRYWRIYITANNGGSTVRITEARWIVGGVDTPPFPLTSNSSPSPYVASASSTTSNRNPWEAYRNVTNSESSTWQSSGNVPQWLSLDFGTDVAPTAIFITARDTGGAVPANQAPLDFQIQYSDDNSNWNTLTDFSGQTAWAAGEEREFVLSGDAGPYFYNYRRSQSTTVPDARNGSLFPSSVLDTTPRVELFPIRHATMTNLSTSANSMDDWYIYKSTLPLSDRTLSMPSNRNSLDGINYSSGNVLIASNRTTNFGYSGSPTGNHNWFVMLNNAPEMLARQADGSSGITFETTADTAGIGANGLGFSYNGSDTGGYYGNDNLCMIDGQEKKIVVFTELDLAEFTKEALMFNKLDTAWGFTFNSNTATVTDDGMLQNMVYIVNTSMGDNFFGQRVHTGAVRLKRGQLMGYPLSIVSPNAVHIWGDLNCPGYWHHGKNQGSNNVTYTVPATREYDPGTTLSKSPVAIYADSIHAYENSWIRFNPINTSANDIRDSGYGSLQNNLGSGTGDHQERISFDHKLWWEDDGMRRSGATGGADTPVISGFGSQYFMNYHETIFNHDNNDYYLTNSAWNRGRSSQIWKHVPQGINAALMYGNITSKLPSYFYDVDVQPLLSTRPASVDLLTWLMSWIPRSRWVEMERDEMRNDIGSGTVTNGGFDPTIGGSRPEFYAPASDLTPSNYFGKNFPGSGYSEWEEVKLAFSGGGFMYDIRFHTNHTHNLAEWTNGRQTFGRNIKGAFACLFDSRQSTHGYNETILGSENQQIFYAFDRDFEDSDQLPPGTPMTTIIPDVAYTIEGSKWEF